MICATGGGAGAGAPSAAAMAARSFASSLALIYWLWQLKVAPRACRVLALLPEVVAEGGRVVVLAYYTLARLPLAGCGIAIRVGVGTWQIQRRTELDPNKNIH
jgi:hypothetical protein